MLHYIYLWFYSNCVSRDSKREILRNEFDEKIVILIWAKSWPPSLKIVLNKSINKYLKKLFGHTRPYIGWFMRSPREPEVNIFLISWRSASQLMIFVFLYIVEGMKFIILVYELECIKNCFLKFILKCYWKKLKYSFLIVTGLHMDTCK